MHTFSPLKNIATNFLLPACALGSFSLSSAEDAAPTPTAATTPQATKHGNVVMVALSEAIDTQSFVKAGDLLDAKSSTSITWLPFENKEEPIEGLVECIRQTQKYLGNKQIPAHTPTFIIVSDTIPITNKSGTGLRIGSEILATEDVIQPFEDSFYGPLQAIVFTENPNGYLTSVGAFTKLEPGSQVSVVYTENPLDVSTEDMAEAFTDALNCETGRKALGENRDVQSIINFIEGLSVKPKEVGGDNVPLKVHTLAVPAIQTEEELVLMSP